MSQHATELRIDLDAIAANWRTLRDRHSPGAVAAVVKADGYGLGAAPVSRRLHAEGCRFFFTAHLDEALEIRGVVAGAQVAALNGLWPGDAAEYARHDVLPVLGSLAEIAEWSAEARQRSRTLPAILHVDTGMNRLGLDARELGVLVADPSLLDGISLDAVMTHLVSAELPPDPVNRAQRLRFARACERLPPARRSIANSSGLFLPEEFACDLARPGAALFGVNPTPGRPNPMRGVVRLRARVLHVREVGAGERVGYNGIWRAARVSRIATVSVGYADGFSRRLSNTATAFFDGAAIPLVGRVSMDLTTFDVSDQPAVTAGSWIELIGPDQTVDQIAARIGTNGYEVLTQLGRRYARRYVGEPG